MLRRLDFLLDRLLSWVGRNKLLAKIARRVLLTHYVRKGFERIYHFYAVARFEEGYDDFVGGYYSRPWIATPPGHTINVEISERNLIDIKKILDESGLRYWLMFGTFLGAYRDKAIIPYDGDTDLAIYAEDLSDLVSCADTFVKLGFELRVGPAMEAGCPTGLYRDGERAGFALFKLEGSKRVWKSIKYDAGAFETFNEIQFLGQNFRILSDPERWLKYTYGEDWRTPIKGKGVGLGYAYGEKFESG